MANDLDLTDDEIDHILKICEMRFDAPWSEGFQLLRAELQRFLNRGYSAIEATQLSIIFAYGGCQAYVPRVKTFLLNPGTINSRSFCRDRAGNKAHKLRTDDLKKLRNLSSKITDKTHRLDELSRRVSEQREILRQLKILVPRELEQDANQ